MLGSLVFHSQKDVQHQALELFAGYKSFCLARLSFLLYSCNQLSEDTQAYLFTHVIPLLISTSKDPFVVMSGINSIFLLQENSSRILAMYNIWNIYPRVWPKLRSILGETLHKWKLELIKDPKIEAVLSWAIRFLYFLIFRECCDHKSKNIEDLMSLIMNGLSSSYFSEDSQVAFLHGLNACVQDNNLDLRAGILFQLMFFSLECNSFTIFEPIWKYNDRESYFRNNTLFRYDWDNFNWYDFVSSILRGSKV